jgi:hypothetical protein
MVTTSTEMAAATTVSRTRHAEIGSKIWQSERPATMAIHAPATVAMISANLKHVVMAFTIHPAKNATQLETHKLATEAVVAPYLNAVMDI